ncbi:M56 family metallopeptidase [Chitinophaga barathri]|uniref:T9SS C-terminal target domain-containing protein n=1 Tax=Chitinophaga barathri TaxID=1647451 RepID=A0A3N4MLI2_9BACT|nr:M56 family metallopeptidase [Chitinophaga barathri]RPD40920.1 T9SS C-terminal target domain-containing protein [Chitinophaga barathri]
MTALFIYLIKANIALCLFYLAYRLGLRRLTFYTLNRVFLVTGIVFSSLFPLVDVNDFFSRNETIAAQVVQYVPDFGVLRQAAKPEVFTMWVLLEWVFWTGVVVMGIRLLIQLVSLMVLHWRTEPVKLQDHAVRRMDGNINPFSFFRNIYVNPELHSQEELEAIIRHEQVHVSQWHSADVMMSEVNNVFYWFNPGAWLMKTAVKENLEFLTDRKILRSGVNATAYQYSLVKVSAAQYTAGVANNFNFSHLKNRIKMMNKTKSSRVQLYRYGVLAGVVCGVLLSLNYTKAGTVVHNVVSEVKNVLDVQKGDTTTPVPPPPAIDKFDAVKEDRYKTVEDKFKSLNRDEFQTIGDDKTTDGFRAQALTINGSRQLAGRVSGISIKADTFITQKPITIYSIQEPTGEEPAKSTVTYSMKANASYTTTPAEVRTQKPGLRLRATGNATLSYMPDTSRQPLVIVDGKPYPLGKDGNVLSDLDPNTIESIHVLKDQSAAAIYGPAAKNGVLLISTKKNSQKPKVEEVVVTGRPSKAAQLNEVTVVGYGTRQPQEEGQQLKGVVVNGYAAKPAATVTGSGTAGIGKDLSEVVVVGYAVPGQQPEKAVEGKPTEVTVTGYSTAAKEPVKTVEGRSARDTKQAGETTTSETKNSILTLAKSNEPTTGLSTLYPNPTKGIVNVLIAVPDDSANSFLEVNDMNGKTLYRYSLAGFKGNYRGQVDLSRYPAGTYIVRVKLPGADMTSKIIKQ